MTAAEPNRHTKGIKLEIVKFFTFDELFNEKIGCLCAKKDKKMTPQAHTSTAGVWLR